jgi:Lon-like protease
MSRKTATLSFAGVALVLLLSVAFFVPMPYVVMSPGITENTLGTFKGTPVITVHGHKTYPTKGALDLTTVSVTSPDYHPRLGDVLQAWWRKDEIILPREAVYPPDKSVKDVNKQNETDMTNSQTAAIVVALREAGITHFKVEVVDIIDGAPADGALRLGDIITAVDGVRIDDAGQAITAITRLAPGTRVTLRILRGGQPKTVTLRTEPSNEPGAKSRIGVSITDKPPFDVNIDLGQQIGGPSAGLMFSLGIFDKITPGYLTDGAHIAGTGTIDDAGDVGEIGGIQQKIAGAVNAGATVFLVPHANCSEAAGAPDAGDVDLIDVTTMHSAVSALDAIAAGDSSGVPRCSS